MFCTVQDIRVLAQTHNPQRHVQEPFAAVARSADALSAADILREDTAGSKSRKAVDRSQQATGPFFQTNKCVIVVLCYASPVILLNVIAESFPKTLTSTREWVCYD